MQVTQERGTYYFMNTRDNNFSNRAQKWSVTIGGISSAEAFGYVVLGVVTGFVLIAGALVVVVWRRDGKITKGGFVALFGGSKGRGGEWTRDSADTTQLCDVDRTPMKFSCVVC